MKKVWKEGKGRKQWKEAKLGMEESVKKGKKTVERKGRKGRK